MREKFDTTQFALDLASYRKENNLSLAHVGELCGLSHMQVWRIEFKKSVYPNAEAFLILCKLMSKEPFSYMK